MATASRRPIIDIFLLLFFALYFYRLGVTSLEAFFNYPFWKDMGPMMCWSKPLAYVGGPSSRS